jgi:dihydroorotase
MKILIKGGRVIDPANRLDDFLDVLIEDDKIAGLAPPPHMNPENAAIIDAKDKVVVPGLIDMHVHFRQPGRHEYKETIRSGSRAAAMGGFTTVVCEPNTVPPIDNAEKVKQVRDTAHRDGIINIYTKAAITKGLRGRDIVDVKKVVAQGAVALTDDGFPVNDIDVMEKAAREAKKYGIPLCPHCEESRLGRGRKDKMTRFIQMSEARYIERDLHIARDTGCRFHFLHVSLARSLEHIARGKKEGLPISAEATPHHFTLTKDDYRRIGPNAKVNPPLRSAKDVQAIREALKNDLIDVIATDHAPHAPYEKEGPKPPFGVIGVETALGIVLTHLVHARVITLFSAIAKMTTNPAKVLNLPRGNLNPNMPADITIIDPNLEWIVDSRNFESKGRNCPFDGWKLKGKAVTTIVGSRIVMKDGKIFETPLRDPRLVQQLMLNI